MLRLPSVGSAGGSPLPGAAVPHLLALPPHGGREYPEGRGASTLPQNNTLPESPYFARESLSPAEGYNYLPPEG